MSGNVQEPLHELIQETYQKYEKRMRGISPFEALNWKMWKSTMEKECKTFIQKGPPRIAASIRKGIQELKEMNIVIKQADKNLGIVAIRKDIYNHMLNKHLQSTSFKKMNVFPRFDIIRRMENILGTVPENWRFQKWIQHAKNSTEPCPFYIIPKLHKPQLGSRPITAQHSYMLSPLSTALAIVLQEEVNKIPEIARDSKTVVQQLEQLEVKEPNVLITFDVEQMYPSIDLQDAIKVLHENLQVMRAMKGFWTKILQLIMFNNYVTANKNIYRQMTGTATGTQVAPPFANLYLYFKYKSILDKEDVFYKSRYIDDGFIIVPSAERGKTILKQLNDACELNLTFEISNNRAIYLDLEIFKGRRYFNEQRLDMKVYFKPTNKLLYLPANSHHPQAHKAGIIKGEAIRCLRNSSDKIEWLQALNIIFKGLMARGYSAKMISMKWKEVRFEDRKRYIENSIKKELPNRTMVMTKYHPSLKKHWKMLLTKHPLKRRMYINTRGRINKKQQAVLKDWPPLIVFKGFKKIGNLLIRAKQDNTTA